jgi:hypothetical protein
MGKIENIERQIEALSPEELAQFAPDIVTGFAYPCHPDRQTRQLEDQRSVLGFLAARRGITHYVRTATTSAVAPVRRDSQVARPRASPMSHSFGWASTRVTKALSCFTRLASSFDE